MNATSPVTKTVLAVLRRFATLAGAAILGTVVTGWSDWLVQAAKENVSNAIALAALYTLIEFIQKLLRERRTAKTGG